MASEREVIVHAAGVKLEGSLAWPDTPSGLVLFAHGSGSSRHSPRNRAVAESIREAGIGTLLFDLLTAEEEPRDRYSGLHRFDIGLLSGRLVAATEWSIAQSDARGLPIGYFGASTGAAAALVAAAELDGQVSAVISRGGRPDMAGDALAKVTAPTLLIVGERDPAVIDLNRQAYGQLRGEREMAIVPGATHLFEEPGTLEQVAQLAVAWLRRHLLLDTAFRPGERGRPDYGAKPAPRR